MDSSKCQTLTATPAEPGELPTELGMLLLVNQIMLLIALCLVFSPE